MHIKYFLIRIIFVPAIVLLSSTAANAQGAVSYGFLEIVDSADKPVADATVDVRASCDGGEKKTNEKGQLEKGLPIGFGDCHTDGFSVSKTGYYPFTDIFGVTRRSNEPLKLELLVVPKTRAELKIVGDEQFKREFFAAAKTADIAAVRKFLKMGLSPNLTTSDLRGVPGVRNVPVILFAVYSGDIETIKAFLDAGVSIRRKDEPVRGILATYLTVYLYIRRYPKTEAEGKEIMNAFEDGAEILVKAGADINPPNANGETTLMITAQRGFVRTAKLLIEKGVPVNAKDSYGRTALMYAIDISLGSPGTGFQIDTINLLLKSGADPNIISDENSGFYRKCDTALISAIRARNLEVVKLLLASKADVNLSCKNGDTALTFARQQLSYYANDDKMREIVKVLEDAGAK